jgi:hypothetical protein
MPTQDSVTARPKAEIVQKTIPYREENGSLAVDAGSALLTAILLLGLMAIALRFAQRRGLLRRWVGVAAQRGNDISGMKVEHALRISPKTMVYRVRDGESHYLLVESLAQVQVIRIEHETSLRQSLANDEDQE